MKLKEDYAEDRYARKCQKFALETISAKNESVICVIPCGAGKTYIGVAQLCRDVKNAVSASSAVSTSSTIDFLIAVPIREIIYRWRDELCKCTTISPSSIVIVDSKTTNLKKIRGPVRIFLITYSMLRSDGHTTNHTVEQLKKIIYRRVICDECHHVPGENTYRVLLDMKGRWPKMKWMGLTASPINSADKDFTKMIQLMGPQIDGGMSWKSMQQEKYIAPLKLTNVLCPLPKLWSVFYNELLNNQKAKDRGALMRYMELFNPNKLAYIDSIAQKALHEGHKFILFCDNVQLLREMARVMQCEYVDGTMAKEDRERIYAELRCGTRRMLLVSRVADTGLDFPDVDWAGQVDALGGSQRQKTQRVGRVLRYKEGKQAAFWDVVTTHTDHYTHEEIFLRGRDHFLSQQDYQIVDEVLRGTSSSVSQFLSTEEQTSLFNIVKAYPDIKRECKEIHDDYNKQLKQIVIKRPTRNIPTNLKFKAGQDRALQNHKARMKEFEDKKRTLRFERDELLKGAKALVYLDESEFGDASVDEYDEGDEFEGRVDEYDEGAEDEDIPVDHLAHESTSEAAEQALITNCDSKSDNDLAVSRKKARVGVTTGSVVDSDSDD